MLCDWVMKGNMAPSPSRSPEPCCKKSSHPVGVIPERLCGQKESEREEEPLLFECSQLRHQTYE